MLGDSERSGAYASEQRRMVRDAVAAEVLAFTPYWREAAAEVGLRSPTEAGDLVGLPPRPLRALGPPDALVLRPSPEAVRKDGPKPLRRRLRRARFGRGSTGAMRRILDPLYKPVHWVIEGEVPIGCTEADLQRLAEVGRRSLEVAGVTGDDAIVGFIPPGPTLCALQLSLGAREAGIPLAGLAPSATLEAVGLLGPTVLAGRPADLLRVLDGLKTPERSAIATVLTISRAPLSDKARQALARAAGTQAAVIESWAPPGVRALWVQCRGGEGVHTWPQTELLEVCGPDGVPTEPGEEGELVWTGLGWRGTTFVRLATGMRGRVVEGSCDACGRTTPRILDAQPIDGSLEFDDLREAPAERTAPARPARARRAARIASATPRPAHEAPEPVTGPAPGDDGPGPQDDGAFTVSVRLKADRPGPTGPTTDGGHTDAEAVPAGVVRAVAKEPDVVEEARADRLPPPQARAVEADRPEAPDVVGGRLDDDWLPETGEVDAWPAPVLASTDGLAAWQVEHRRRRGHDDLVVHLALADGVELGEVLVALERSIGATQYVVGTEADVAARLAAADGRRIVDRRGRHRGTHAAPVTAARAERR